MTLRALGAAAVAALALLAGAAGARGAVSDQPQVAVDEDGNAHFTWRRTDGIDIVKTRKRAPNGTLSAVQDLSAAGQDARDPQLAVDPQGNAYFVWARWNGSYLIVQTRKRAPNGALGAVQDLSATGGSAVDPQVAVDPQGNAYFVWARFNGSSFIVQARKRSANGTLGPVQDLSAAGQSALDPQVAVDPQGNAYFVWRRFNGTHSIVQFRRRAANGALGAAQNLSAPGQHAFRPQLAVDPQGNTHFTWRRFDGSSSSCCYRIQTRRRAAGGGLSAVQDLSDPGANADDPQLAVDPQGNAIFVWEALINYHVVQTRRRAANGTLSAVQDLGAPESDGFDPEVAVDPTGTASFAWLDLDGADRVVQTRRRTAEGLLSDLLDLSLSGAVASHQRLGVDPVGNAYFVWERNNIIQTRRRAPDGTLTAVQNVTG